MHRALHKTGKVLRGLLVAATILSYALLVHHVNTLGTASTLGAALALAPIGLVVLAIASKTAHKGLGLALLLLFALVSWWGLPFLRQHTALVFWLQDISLMLLLLLTFARTLLHNQQPLCVQFAEQIHGSPLPIAHARYARRVTIAWVLFFTGMMMSSTLLFWLAPLAMWSIFVNFLTLPLVACMFIAEYIVRRQVLTDLPAGSALDAVRAYLSHAKRV